MWSGGGKGGAVSYVPPTTCEPMVRDLLASAPQEFVAVVAQWLERECGCDVAYVGLRWPPAFTALLCDVSAECLLPHARAARLPGRAPGLHPYQAYSVWLVVGRVGIPSRDELTMGWNQAGYNGITDRPIGASKRLGAPTSRWSYCSPRGGRCTEAVLRAFHDVVHPGPAIGGVSCPSPPV